MIDKPAFLSSLCAEAFQDQSVVAAYRYRPPYPTAIFDILVGLIHVVWEYPGDGGRASLRGLAPLL